MKPLRLELKRRVPRNVARARQRPAAGGRQLSDPPGADSRTSRLKCQPASGSKRSISSSIVPPSGDGEVEAVRVTDDPAAISLALVVSDVDVSWRITSE